MAVDIPDWTQAVNVTGGSVSITGTATVQITGTPTVSISGTPTVNVGNTPSVTINSGTVTATISGTPNINIQSQSVSLNVVLPQALQATINVTAGGSQNVAVPTGCHALGIAIGAGALSSLKVIGHVSGVNYWPGVTPGSRAMGAGSHVIVPIFSALDTSVDITWTFTANTTIWVLAILDTEAVVPVPDQIGQVPGFMGVTLYDATVSAGNSLIGQKTMGSSIPVALASDQTGSISQQPNKEPLQVEAAIAASGTVTLIVGVPGQSIYLFYWSGTIDSVAAGGWYRFRHPVAGATLIAEFSTQVLGPQVFDFKGVKLPSGDGLEIVNSPVVGGIVLRGTLLYSQG